MNVKFLVDAGYLSWVYGSGSWGINSWTMAKMNYSAAAGALMLLDSRKSVRKDRMPEYKAHRAARAEADPHKLQQRELVRQFRQRLNEDRSLRTLLIQGLEADDLIAMYIYMRVFPGSVRVVGMDKDLLQLPASLMSLEANDGSKGNLQKFAGSQAKAVQPFITQSWHVMLTLALLGDSSDNIPRVVPPRRFDGVTDLYSHPKPFTTAVERFGLGFLENLWAVVLPHPSCLSPELTPETLASYLDEAKHQWVGGDYKIRSDYQEMLSSALRTLKPGEVYQQLIGDEESDVVDEWAIENQIIEVSDETQLDGPLELTVSELTDLPPSTKLDFELASLAARRVHIEELKAQKSKFDREYQESISSLLDLIKLHETEEEELASSIRERAADPEQGLTHPLLTLKKMKGLEIENPKELKDLCISSFPAGLRLDEAQIPELISRLISLAHSEPSVKAALIGLLTKVTLFDNSAIIKQSDKLFAGLEKPPAKVNFTPQVSITRAGLAEKVNAEALNTYLEELHASDIEYRLNKLKDEGLRAEVTLEKDVPDDSNLW